MSRFEISPGMLGLSQDVPVTELTVETDDLGTFVFSGGGTVTLRSDAQWSMYLEVQGVMEADRPLDLKPAPALMTVAHRLPDDFVIPESWWESVGEIAEGAGIGIGSYVVNDDTYWSLGGPPLALGSATVVHVLVSEAGEQCVYTDGFLVGAFPLKGWSPHDPDTGQPLPPTPSTLPIRLPQGHLYSLSVTDDGDDANPGWVKSQTQHLSGILGRPRVEWDNVAFEDEPPGFLGWAVVAVEARGGLVGRDAVSASGEALVDNQIPVFGDGGVMHVSAVSMLGVSAPVEVVY